MPFHEREACTISREKGDLLEMEPLASKILGYFSSRIQWRRFSSREGWNSIKSQRWLCVPSTTIISKPLEATRALSWQSVSLLVMKFRTKVRNFEQWYDISNYGMKFRWYETFYLWYELSNYGRNFIVLCDMPNYSTKFCFMYWLKFLAMVYNVELTNFRAMVWTFELWQKSRNMVWYFDPRYEISDYGMKFLTMVWNFKLLCKFSSYAVNFRTMENISKSGIIFQAMFWNLELLYVFSSHCMNFLATVRTFELCYEMLNYNTNFQKNAYRKQ
jgi:hypothetical protein